MTRQTEYGEPIPQKARKRADENRQFRHVHRWFRALRRHETRRIRRALGVA